MGKFDGVLLASDFDNTLIYTEAALRSGEPVPDLSPRNREALEYFMGAAASRWPPAGHWRPSGTMRTRCR